MKINEKYSTIFMLDNFLLSNINGCLTHWIVRNYFKILYDG